MTIRIEDLSKEDTFSQIRLRWILLIIILWLVLSAVSSNFLSGTEPEYQRQTIESVLFLISVNVFIFALTWIIWFSKFNVSEVFGSIPRRPDLIALSLLAIPMAASSFFFIYLLFFPLSYIAPDFVSFWVLAPQELVVFHTHENSIAINLSVGFLLITLAPIFEELIFRGIIFTRMQHKYGRLKSIIFSSISFGIFHDDILGSAIFGIFCCLIYLKYKSLIAPIIMHSTNNFIAVFIGLIEINFPNSTTSTPLEDFRSSLWIGVICGLFSIPILYSYYRKNLRKLVTEN